MSQHKHLWKLRKTVFSHDRDFYRFFSRDRCTDYLSVQTTFLEANINKLDTLEDRQKVVAVFTKETKETFDVERIHTWFRNHKKKNKGGGQEGEGGS